MEDSAKHDFLLITTVEVALVGLFSLVSVCIYSVILWTSLTSIGNDEEDRWSFKRSMKAVTLTAIVQNIYQVVFLIVQTTNITFNLLENVNTATKTTEAFSAIDQLLYCNFVYFLALSLMKPLVWPRLRFDTYIYLITSVPAILNAIIRFTLIMDMSHMDHSTQSAVITATSVVTSFHHIFGPTHHCHHIHCHQQQETTRTFYESKLSADGYHLHPPPSHLRCPLLHLLPGAVPQLRLQHP